MALLPTIEEREILVHIAEGFSIEFENDEVLSEAMDNADEAMGKQVIIKMIDAGIKANGDASKLVTINKTIQHVDDLNWLERLQLKMEKKLREYDQKLKNKETGVISKVFTRIKQFLVKVGHIIAKAINKTVYTAKIGYKAGKDMATGGIGSDFEIMYKKDQMTGKARDRVLRRISVLKNSDKKDFLQRKNASKGTYRWLK